MMQNLIFTFEKLKNSLIIIHFNINIFININKINLFYNILALRTGIWYKPNHVGSKRLNSFLNEICKITGVNLSGRKITNHSGRRALIQNCEKMGIPKEEIKLLSRHRSDAGLLSYTLPPDDKKNEIVEQFMNKIHGKSTLGIKNLFNYNHYLLF
jgi:hypothetical protein